MSTFLVANEFGMVESLGRPVLPWTIVAGEGATIRGLGGLPASCDCRWRAGGSPRGCRRCAGGTVWPAGTMAARRALVSRFEAALGRTLDLVGPAIQARDQRTACAAWTLAITMRHHIRSLGLRVSEGRMFHLLNVRRAMVAAWMLPGR